MNGRIPVFWLVCCASPMLAQVLPHVDCVDSIDFDRPTDQSPTLQVHFPHFGYFNAGSETVTNPAGSSINFLTPGLSNRGQPGTFPPGRVHYAFSSAFTANRDLTWILGSQFVIARRDPKRVCSAVPKAPFLIPHTVNLTAGTTSQSVELMKLNWASPSPQASLSVSSVIQGLGDGSIRPTSDISISNLRLTPTALLGDVTVVPTPTHPYYVLTIRILEGNETLTAKTARLDAFSSCPITVTPNALPAAAVNVPYAPVAFTGSGATAPYQFELTTGSRLPAGMQLVNGTLSGTPTEAGSFVFAIDATSASRCLTRQSYTLVVGGPSCAADITGQVSLTLGGFRQNLVTRRWQQSVTLTNSSGGPIQAPVVVALQSLSPNASLVNATGTTQCALPAGRPYLSFGLFHGPLAARQTLSATLEFVNDSPSQAITYTPRILAGGQGQ
jgi:hypothetical protein